MNVPVIDRDFAFGIVEAGHAGLRIDHLDQNQILRLIAGKNRGDDERIVLDGTVDVPARNDPGPHGQFDRASGRHTVRGEIRLDGDDGCFLGLARGRRTGGKCGG